MVSFFNYPKRNLRKLIKNGDYKDAITFANQLLVKNPFDTDVLFILAGTYYILEDAPSVLRYVEKILEISDSDIDTLILKANTLVTQGNKEKAIHCCREILKIEPEHRQANTLLKNLSESS